MTLDRFHWRRVRVQTGIFFAGIVASALAAGMFNASGLTLSSSGFGTAMAWDPTESGYGVAIGVVCALAWLGTVFLGVRMAGFDVHSHGVRTYGWTLVILNIVIAVVLCFFAIVVLPTQYGYVP